jgi:hypothetical protein
MSTLDKIQIGSTTYKLNSSYRWFLPSVELYTGSLYNIRTKSIKSTGTSFHYTCAKALINGEKKLRFSGSNSGSSEQVAYAFVDADNNVISTAEYGGDGLFINEVVDIPRNATEVYVNGGSYVSPSIELSVEDEMSDIHTLYFLLENFGKRLQYKDTFAWKPMDTGYIAFTFDDSLEDTADIVDLFISKGVPCCFGAIPDKLNISMENGETIAQAMKRGVVAVGCEVLAHGDTAREIVTADNIDDMNFLYKKFVINKKKFADCGFNVRGTVRTGGDGNICGDPRTDVWVRLFFDYGDLYGVEEPHNHPRVSLSTGFDGYKSAIDKAIANKEFAPLLFHHCPDYMSELIDYAIAQGAVICNYATVYDTFGSTAERVDVENRLKTIESFMENADGNEVSY